MAMDKSHHPNMEEERMNRNAPDNDESRQQDADWYETCDRCLDLQLECYVASSSSPSAKTCRNCRDSHNKCTIGGIRVTTPGVAFKIRKEAHFTRTTEAVIQADTSTGSQHIFSRARRRPGYFRNEERESSLTEDGSLDVESSYTVQEASLDAYTFGLLKDTKQAIRRCQVLLADPETLPAARATLTLLVDDFTSLPICTRHPTLAKLADYLRRFLRECVPTQAASLRSNEVKQSERLLLAKTLFDRCLSLIDMLLADAHM